MVVEDRSVRRNHPGAGIQEVDLVGLVFFLWQVVIEIGIAGHVMFLAPLSGEAQIVRWGCDDHVDGIVGDLAQ